MDWKNLGKKIASAGAGLLGTAIAGPAGSGLGSIVADVLGVENDPDSISQAIDKDPQAAIKLQEIQSQERVRLQEIASSQVLAEISADTERQRTVNETMRAELLAQDHYRARWRPTFGYIMAFDMAILSLGFFAAIIAILFDPQNATAIAEGFSVMVGSFLTIFSVALGVLGIQVNARSKDKRLAAGVQQPAGVLSRLLGKGGGNES